MASQALGLLETKGLTALVSGVDAMLKAADVEIAAPMKAIGGGLACAQVKGDVAAVKAAIEAGAQAAEAFGPVVSAHVIARPHEDLPASKTAAAKK